MERIVLKGLQVAEFVHPQEAEKRHILETPKVQKLIESVGEMMLKAMETIKEGTYVRLDAKNEPRAVSILEDVCRILDFPHVPDLYVYHNDTLTVVPCGAQEAYIVTSDYVLRRYDDDMLYYAFGNAVTMLKAGHAELSSIGAYMPGNLVTMAPKAMLAQFLHAADATSDRGGLLACQSFAAALRCHLYEMGLPPQESRKLFKTDVQAACFAVRYLDEARAAEKQLGSKLYGAVRELERLNSMEQAPRVMLEDMYRWYTDPQGYSAVMAKYAMRQTGGTGR